MTKRTIAANILAKKKLLTGAVLGGSLLALAACDKAPEGQVVAVVNGDEITQQEVNLALADARVPDGIDEDEARNAALGNLINRRLAAEIAREDGVDATPEFIVRQKQVEEALLLQMLTQKLGRDVIPASGETVDQFIAENPQMFAERKMMQAEQIRFLEPARPDYLDALAGTNNLAEVETVLNRLGIKFERGNTRIDSGTLDPGLYQTVIGVGTREPIVIPSRGGVTVTQLLRIEDAPIANDEARAVAEASMRQQAVNETLRERLEKAKEEAGIDYQSGYGPAESDDVESDVKDITSQAAE
jgi:EpsD family peptidyl-prolyl cis-trans isomerase